MIVFFLTVVNRSISASWTLMAVLLLRCLLKKAPKWSAILLWGIVALRLVCPVSFESVLSLLPSAETLSPEGLLSSSPHIESGIPAIDHALNPVIGGSLAPSPEESANPLQILLSISVSAWVAGVVALWLYAAVSYLLVHRRVKTAVLLKEGLYQCETVRSPFVLGIVNPKIYLPFEIGEVEVGHVIAHEQAHIKRKDHLFKPLGFLLLTLHWFNPLMWLGYALFGKDVELACDESVVKGLSASERADYSQALLSFSANRHRITACPLTFGEVGVKERIKHVLGYKKPAFWVVMAALLLVIIASVCFLTDPKGEGEAPTDPISAVTEPSIKIVSVGSELSSVSVEVISLLRNENGQLVLKLRWNNHTDETIQYGLPFQLWKQESGEWVDLKAEGAWLLPAYPVLPLKTDDEYFRALNRDCEFPISLYYPIEERGGYRFITDFSLQNNGTKNYRVWVDFSIEE